MIQDPNSTNTERLYMAFELSNTQWKLAFGNGVKMRFKQVAARDREQLGKEINRAKLHFLMKPDATVFSCYEAGRDGFWIHRYLREQGIENIVVDSSSIEVNRRYRRAKTDHIDVRKLLTMLIRYLHGETKLWSVLHVPDVDQEDARRLDREIERLKKEKSAHTNRITSLLILHGIKTRVGPRFLDQLDRLTQYNGAELPERLKNEILREFQRYELTQSQLKQLKDEKKQALAQDDVRARQVQTLQSLKGIGPVSSWLLIYEFFGWRRFNNVKQVGAAAGLAPTPYDSGGSSVEQGISKAGNRRIRAVMIEVAWYWLRYQPQSELSRWYAHRYAGGSKRTRRIGVVALARKLLVALWKYLEKQQLPDGAVLKQVA